MLILRYIFFSLVILLIPALGFGQNISVTIDDTVINVKAGHIKLPKAFAQQLHSGIPMQMMGKVALIAASNSEVLAKQTFEKNISFDVWEENFQVRYINNDRVVSTTSFDRLPALIKALGQCSFDFVRADLHTSDVVRADLYMWMNPVEKKQRRMLHHVLDKHRKNTGFTYGLLLMDELVQKIFEYEWAGKTYVSTWKYEQHSKPVFIK
ncbi:MAG: hypothetical protein R3A45_08255 [Bdellovibrionota bacterium]